MSVLKTHYDKNVNVCSPVKEDVQLVISYDEDGNELISFEPVDYSAVIAEHGDVNLWALKSLLKAGINPGSFSIHTSANSRIENESGVQQMLQDVVDYYASIDKENASDEK